MGTKIPITIVTGCLGSGKTTVLNYLLGQIKNDRTAVIVNEFGKAGLDHHLLRRSQEKISLIDSGCMCCNSREDLEAELKDLLDEHERSETGGYERIIIETTGLADPAPIVFTILRDPVLQNRYEVELILTTVDMKNAGLQFENSPEFVKQVSVSDHIIMTKEDLVSEETKEKVISQVTELNPSAKIFHAINGVVDTKVLEKDTTIPVIQRQSDENRPFSGVSEQVQSISFTFSSELNWTGFTLWLSLLLHTHGENILRVKGIVDVGEEAPVNLNGVQHIIHPPEHLDHWPEDVEQSFLVFIVRKIQPMTILRSLETFQKYIGSDAALMEYQESI